MPPRDPNLVTAEAATQGAPTGDTADVTVIEPGAVLQKGAPPPDATPGRKPPAVAQVRITKKGHGRVHDGQGGYYDWNDVVALPQPIAQGLEDRGFGEIQP